MKRLQNRRAIVTGGASGIGAATVERFRAEGAEVFIFDIVPGDGVRVVDVSDGDQVDRAFKDIGAVDIVVNNASSTTPASASATPPSTSPPASGSECWRPT